MGEAKRESGRRPDVATDRSRLPPEERGRRFFDASMLFVHSRLLAGAARFIFALRERLDERKKKKKSPPGAPPASPQPRRPRV